MADGRIRRLVEAAEERTGLTVQRRDRVELLEASDWQRRTLQRDLDLLAYTALDYFGGNEQDLKAVERRKLAQRSRVAWQKDPQAGAAVDLQNDFTFGRGVPRPKCADPKVQEVVDEAWDDADNKLILTTYAAQLSLGVDLSTQSNIFFLLFDEGTDGKVKIGLLEHDAVENVVRDENFRQRILYYVARRKVVKWDFRNDQAQVVSERDRDNIVDRPVRYFEHWENVETAKEENPSIELAPEAKLGKGKVFHLWINKTTEAAFGHPVMDRTLRWFTAYNNFMEARVDMARAAAALIMKRKVQGTPNQVQKMATQMLSRRGVFGQALELEEGVNVGPKPASTVTENAEVSHESMKLDSGAGNAETDGQMIRSQISAATHFPQHYLGDAGSANLATATSMELPVLKHIEGRQEVFEGLFRWFIDKVIEKAVESGRIPEELSAEEQAARKEEDDAKAANREKEIAPQLPTPPPPSDGVQGPTTLQAAHADAVEDEAETKRDLSYEFSMPSPLRRMLGDLIGAIEGIAKTFDPNGTNIELSRVLLGVALGEGLEVEDPAAVVERVFPPGYEDPALAAALNQQRTMQPGDAPGEEEENENPYGGRMQAASPEENPYGAQEARFAFETSVLAGRGGVPIRVHRLREARFKDLPREDRERADDFASGLLDRFDEDVTGRAEKALAAMLGEHDA